MGSHLDIVSEWAQRGRAAHYHARELAVLSGVSLRQLQRFFQQKFGRPPQRWLDELLAADALLSCASGNHVKEVAYEFGFSHPSHFIRLFQRIHGDSPLHFLAAHPEYNGSRPKFSPAPRR